MYITVFAFIIFFFVSFLHLNLAIKIILNIITYLLRIMTKIEFICLLKKFVYIYKIMFIADLFGITIRKLGIRLFEMKVKG